MPPSRAALITLTILVLLFCARETLATAHPSDGGHSFHCQRSFASLDEIAQLAKLSPETNCVTPYFNVTEASVHVECDTDRHAETTCRAAVSVGLRVADNIAARLATQLGSPDDFFTTEGQRALWLQDVIANMPTEATDPWRYALSLRSKRHGATVAYKGFDGNGFSMCCDLLSTAAEENGDEDSAARPPYCQRLAGSLGDDDMAQDVEGKAMLPFRIVRRCPLPVPLSQVTVEPADKTVRGVVTKPLHVLVDGPWVAELDLWRSRGRWIEDDDDDDEIAAAPSEREALLRIRIPFNVSRGLWDSGIDLSSTHAVPEQGDNSALQPVEDDL